jgi:prepilin-type N-terminal cleavage/methylation domain-containing protein
MKFIHTRLRRLRSEEQGLSLVEVVIAVVIIATVALASAQLAITGIAASATQERAQVAVTIANGQMETVSGSAVSTCTATGVSCLYTGRMATGPTGVSTAFANNSIYPGVANTYQGSDPTATSASTVTLPISFVSAQNGTKYTVTTLIGPCYEATTVASATTASECKKLPSVPGNTAPVNPVAGYTQLIRAIVLITWTAGKTCSVTACSYEATTLIDPNVDATWVTHG